MEKFLKERGIGNIIDQSVQNGDITETQRRKVIGQVHEYLKVKCKTMQKTNIIAAAKCLVMIFPCLKESNVTAAENDFGIVSCLVICRLESQIMFNF